MVSLSFRPFHILPSFHDFSTFYTPPPPPLPAKFLQRVDILYRVHAAPSHVRNLLMYSLLCSIQLLFVLFNLPSITCNFTMLSQYNSHRSEFRILHLIIMHLTLGAYILQTNFNNSHFFN